jgi:hypothetical protein
VGAGGEVSALPFRAPCSSAGSGSSGKGCTAPPRFAGVDPGSAPRPDLGPDLAASSLGSSMSRPSSIAGVDHKSHPRRTSTVIAAEAATRPVVRAWTPSHVRPGTGLGWLDLGTSSVWSNRGLEGPAPKDVPLLLRRAALGGRGASGVVVSESFGSVGTILPGGVASGSITESAFRIRASSWRISS